MTQGIGGPSYPGSPPQSIRWLPFRNDAGETIPPFACMRVTGATTANGQRVYTVAKPNGSGTVHMINGPTQVTVAQLYGAGSLETPATVLYNTSSGTPAHGETWGPKGGQWSLEKGYAGYTIIGGNLGSGSTARTEVSKAAPPGEFCYRTATTYGTTMAATLLNRGQIYSVDSSNYFWDDSGGGIKVTVPGWYRAVGRCRFNLEATTGNDEYVNATGGIWLKKNTVLVPRSNRQCAMHQSQLHYMYGFTDTHTQRTVFDVGIAANVLVQGDDMVYTPLYKTVLIDDLIRELLVEMPVELAAGDEITLDNTSSISGTYTSATMRVGAAALMGQYFGHEASLALYRM